MKKSIMIPMCGIAVAFMLLQLIANKKAVYAKTERYEVKEEAIVNFIGNINVYENIKDRNGYVSSTPKEFKESISLRYRTFIKTDESYGDIFGSIPYLIEYKLDEIHDQYIINKYEDSFKLIDGYKRSDDITYYSLKGTGISLYKTIDKGKIRADGTVDLNNLNLEDDYYTEDISLYLVVVDEGEGYVIDYYERIY